MKGGELENMAVVILYFDPEANEITTAPFIDGGMSDMNFVKGAVTTINHIINNSNRNERTKNH